MPRARRLKVFQAQFGFFESVVAAPSQAAALKAWGTHQDLFASGDAKVTADPAAVEAALAHPDTPLQRAVGTKDPYQVKASGSPKALPGSRSAKARPRADRSKLDKAEKALEVLDRDHRLEEAGFEQEQEALDARRAAAREAYADARKKAETAVAKARSAYQKARRD